MKSVKNPLYFIITITNKCSYIIHYRHVTDKSSNILDIKYNFIEFRSNGEFFEMSKRKLFEKLLKIFNRQTTNQCF